MINKEERVSDIVQQNFLTAEVFEKYNIDFCCGGQIPLWEACEGQKVDTEKVINELREKIQQRDEETDKINALPLDELCTYIVEQHHNYVRESLPMLQQKLEKVCKAHGDDHPEVFKIKELFDQSAMELTKHMQKEEIVLFPYVKRMVKAENGQESFQSPPFGHVNEPISVMMEEHDNEGRRFEEISELSNNYTLPQGACNTFMFTYEKLREFEEDLHKHIHLENNILFPKAIELEKQLSQ
ncbi:MAG: iron-sulfur cluster repair di-iron protein [Bacteroidales bacterium]|nr:iron-sulfur cluster repair di-iron protein [Bacteroidales bacterium]